MIMVRLRDRLGVGQGPWESPEVQADPEDDWYASPAGEAYFDQDIPEPAEPRTWTPYPNRNKSMGRVGMGYKRNRKIFKLAFEDPDMEGLVVRCRSTSVERILDMQDLAEAAKNDTGDSGGEAAAMRTLLGNFAEMVISWNLEEDDGTPVPATFEALLKEDFDFAFAMVTAWLEAVTGVSEKLGKGSTPAETPPVESMLLEIPSTPLASSSVPA